MKKINKIVRVAIAIGLIGLAVVLVVSNSHQRKTKLAANGSAVVIIPVEGMSCIACVARVRKTLKDIEGVSEVNVSLEKREAEILIEPKKISLEKLTKAIDTLGYRAGIPRVKENTQ